MSDEQTTRRSFLGGASTAAMAGGLGTVTGPVVGTVILVWIDELIWRQFPILNNFLLGFIIALLILFMPRGIVGTLMQRYPKCRRLIM